MTFEDQRIEKEIERYYAISKFINKYGKIFVILTLSFIYILFNNTDFDVFALESRNNAEIKLVEINGDNINVKGIVFDKENVSLINESLGLSGVEFKVVGSDIKKYTVLTEDEEENTKLVYTVGLAKTDDNLVMPLSFNQNVENIEVLNSSTEDNKHVLYNNIIRNVDGSESIGKVPPKNKNAVSLSSLYSTYNTYCMKNSILKVTDYFCNKNVENMMNNLHKHNMVEGDYRKLFTAFSKDIDNETLCNKAVSIAEYQSNFENIEGIVELYCDEDTQSQFRMAEDVYRLAYTDTSSSSISNDDVRKMYFMGIQKDIYNKNTLAMEDVTAYLENVHNIIKYKPSMFSGDQIFSNQLAYFLSEELEGIVDSKASDSEDNSRKVDLLVSSILNGENSDNISGLLAYTSTNMGAVLAANNVMLHGSPIIVKSFEEAVEEYLNKNSKLFLKTDFQVDDTKKLALVKGVMKLQFNDQGKIVPNEQEITIIIGLNDNSPIIMNGQLNNKELEKYILAKGISLKQKSLLELQKIYSEQLIHPVLYNNYGNTKITICSQIGSCKNNVISSSIRGTSEIGEYSISVTYNIDDDGILNNINIVKKVFTIKDKDSGNSVDINLTSVEGSINKIFANTKVRYSDKSTIESKVIDLINKKVADEIRKGQISIDDVNILNQKFRQYLGITPNNYNKTNDPKKVLVSFTIDEIVFNVLLNTGNNTIERLWLFKERTKENISVNNVRLKFSQVYTDELNKFKIDPAKYIMAADKEAWDQYEAK